MDNSCATCDWNNDGHCDFDHFDIEGDQTQQGCGDWKEIETE